MKKQLVIVAILVLLAAVGGAIGWTQAGGDDKGGREIAVDYSQSGKQIEAAPGDVIKLTLESNATTGFQWQLAGNTDEAAVTPVDHVYVEPQESGGEPLVGAGGHEEWTFKAAAEGASTLTLEYSQPWEGGTKAEKTFAVTIVVK